jgi:DNA mismatch endonuclease (patch repair protein)
VADTISKEERSRLMAAVRSRGNKSTELALVVLFRAAKVTGWRRHLKLPGRPDFAFPKARVAVFVDGCFWHGCKTHGRIPSSNRAFWKRKLKRNMERDREARKALRARGWRVMRVWEHQLKEHPATTLRRIRAALDCSGI